MDGRGRALINTHTCLVSPPRSPIQASEYPPPRIRESEITLQIYLLTEDVNLNHWSHVRPCLASSILFVSILHCSKHTTTGGQSVEAASAGRILILSCFRCLRQPFKTSLPPVIPHPSSSRLLDSTALRSILLLPIQQCKFARLEDDKKTTHYL
ncbi:hypothetical protein RSOLAG1IB_08991 [Rhizoctonia solani AG-1 IB]|uniref:Uncharacterized protein n=1 Tax=Thanatephorus cucumeris (strain AG1-IB / isolate 7/3/14) TaxID=1108050 RepID=A0A0B7FRY8_THACB|nr:hypothetical protein RSOLAG1IB_08991 [Rhizoctonia solani AG-1 IB]